MEHLEIDLSTQERSLLFLCLGIAAGSNLNRSTTADIVDLAAKFSRAFDEGEAKWGYQAAPPLEH